jgi:hypothetical protein
MMHLLQLKTRIAAFAAACLMALTVNGAVLLGADQLAAEGFALQYQAALACQNTLAVASGMVGG